MKNKMRKLIAVLMTAMTICSCTACSFGENKQQESYKQEGMEALSSGDYTGAIDKFHAALGESNAIVGVEEIDISYYLAAAQFLSGDVDGAIATYTNLIAFDEEDAKPLFLRGSLYLDTNQNELALADYKAAIACDDKNYQLYTAIYYNLQAKGLTEDALEYTNMALAIEGNKAHNYMERGKIYLILEQYDVAETTFKKAVNAGDADGYIYLAQIASQAGDSEGAMKYLKKFQKSGEESSEAYDTIGKLYMLEGNYKDALEQFDKGLSLEKITNEKDLRKDQIAALEYSGDFAGARDKALEYVELYPEDATVARELVFLQTR
ncbi:MAG: tetratricopeptide repeat protein [Lachnospiraceae bacterium]|nr:tetratricopeptide repeat protein [Lachnospiraceae bacterium]